MKTNTTQPDTGGSANKSKPVSILGTGFYLPERILTNADLEKMVDTSNEWIITRTGIEERHLASDEEATSDLSTKAALRALKSANIKPEELDLLLVGTSTPDMPFPNTASIVQQNIGAVNATAFSLEAACSSFIFAMETARNFITSGTMKNALVIGADKLSAFVDWEDRATCVLFGDGAGAVVLTSDPTKRGIISNVLGTDGRLGNLLKIPAGGSRKPPTAQTVADKMHFIKMEGREVFKSAVTLMTSSAQQVLKQAGMNVEDVGCIIPHQANVRIIKAIRDRLGGNDEQYFVNVNKYGNMSAGSIAVAFCEAIETGRIKRGDTVLLVVFGAGFTWGATLLEY
ncbi:MAG: ketoacyl-ACP synthase III [Lentisphaerae bacterium]|nr:ketoacyl-ACP synthase III [Lentisphaerota bacterium]